MTENKLWDALLNPSTLKKGWNLARNDAKTNFFEVPFYTDTFAVSFEQNIIEIVKRLATNTYRPSPISFVEIPKSTLSIRPGSLPDIEDRIVLQTIVFLLAPSADAQLPDSVYSYRLKEKPTSAALFKESDVLDIPYLKSKTITKYFDPFDPWYAAWPEFDEKSKAAFQADGYEYLVVTDIAAYFENIQLPLLRDSLLKIFPHEQKIINLLMMFLEQWCPTTDQHRSFHRGIPQGTQISSFLGNLFLLPLDRELELFCQKYNAKYFRYMDDIRLFTKDYPTARKALLQIDRTIRALHLNTQSAKTEILAEHPHREITARLIDVRLDQVNFVIETIQEKKRKKTLGPKEHKLIDKRLDEIAKKQPFSATESKLFGAQKPLKGLSFRTFRRWLTAHTLLGGTYYIRFLIRELKRNPDYRLTRKLVSVARSHPKLSCAGLHSFIESDLNLFPHQHAEILSVFRYLSKIPPGMINQCMTLVLDTGQYFYVRSSAALLLSRVVLDKPFLDKCRTAFLATDNANVAIGLATVLMQSTGKLAPATLDVIVFHPNEKIRRFGKLLRQVRVDVIEAKSRMKFLFSSPNDWILCDQMALLFSMSHSDRIEILDELISRTLDSSKSSSRMQLRNTLATIAARAAVQRSNVLKGKQQSVPVLKLVV